MQHNFQLIKCKYLYCLQQQQEGEDRVAAASVFLALAVNIHEHRLLSKRLLSKTVYRKLSIRSLLLSLFFIYLFFFSLKIQWCYNIECQ